MSATNAARTGGHLSAKSCIASGFVFAPVDLSNSPSMMPHPGPSFPRAVWQNCEKEGRSFEFDTQKWPTVILTFGPPGQPG
jgi:hypothetical protein